MHENVIAAGFSEGLGQIWGTFWYYPMRPWKHDYVAFPTLSTQGLQSTYIGTTARPMCILFGHMDP